MTNRGTAALVASMRRQQPRPMIAAAPASLARARQAGELLGLASAVRPAAQLAGVGGILPEFTGPEAARARINAVDGFLSGLDADMRREIGRGVGGQAGADLGNRWAGFFSRWLTFRNANSNDPYTTFQTLSSASIGNQADQYEEDGKKYRAELVGMGGVCSTPAPAEKPIDPNLAAVSNGVKYAAIAIVAICGVVLISKAKG